MCPFEIIILALVASPIAPPRDSDRPSQRRSIMAMPLCQAPKRPA